MTNEKMTIHRALAELKVLEDRIESEINDANFCTAAKHSETKLNGMSIEQYKAVGAAAFQKIKDLIKRRDAIKRAVIDSNSRTEVEIGGETYTVAMAISMKQHGLDMYDLLYKQMLRQHSYAVGMIERKNADLEINADAMLKQTFGQQAEKSGMNADTIPKFREAYMAPLRYELFDCIDIKAKIDELHDWIDKFSADVDAALSASNAVTTIEISY